MTKKRFSYERKNDLNSGYCVHCIRDSRKDEVLKFTSYHEIIDLLNSLNDDSEQAEYWEDKYKRREFFENELEGNLKLIYTLMDNITIKENENEQLRREKKRLQRYINKIENDYYDYYTTTLMEAEWFK